MLIASRRHRADDLERWAYYAKIDAIEAKRWKELKTLRALDCIAKFARVGGCYAGVSWGKDSTVLAHLVATLTERFPIRLPLVWIRVEPIVNPDCAVVRDLFLTSHPAVEYHEVETWCRQDDDGWHAKGTLEAGFAEAAKVYGHKHVSGVRGDESGQRKARMRAFGTTSENTCAPIGWWSGQDVFTYLHLHNLPVHPAYACFLHSTFERERIRVASLGGKRGDGMGRAEWESVYYREELGRCSR